MKHLEALLQKLDESLQNIDENEIESMERSKHSLSVCDSTLGQMKDYVLRNGFRSDVQG